MVTTTAADPVRLGSHVLSNRMMMTPHLGRLSPGRLLDYLRERVDGGAAIVVVPAGAPVYGASAYPDAVNHVPDGYHAEPDVTMPGAPDPEMQRVWGPAAQLLGEAASIVHAAGSLLVGQIHHPGAERSWDNFQPVLAPSAVDGEWPAQHPHVLTDEEVDRVVESYVANAQLIVAAGLDGVEVHAAHGYLLNRFLSPAYNRRKGPYGGSHDARWHVLRVILREVRLAIGADTLLGVRLPAFEEVPGGLTIAQVAAGVASCRDDLDYVNLTVGNHDGLAQGHPVLAYTTPWLAERPSLAAACAAVKAASDLPVVVTGGVASAVAVDELLAAGADLVGVARAVIADPGFVSKVLAGRGAEVVPCIGCNECVLVPLACPVNPRAGRERELTRAPAPRRRRVLVVGGGVGGLSAALAARDRGHDVTLLERQDALGGRLARIVADPARARFAGLLESLTRQARSGIEIRLGQALALGTAAELDSEVVVVATGATIVPADFSTDGSVELLTSDQVLAGARPSRLGDVVVVAGSEPHVDPPLIARLLAGEGHRVRLTTTLPAIAPSAEQRTLNTLLAGLARRRVQTHTSTAVVRATVGTVTLQHLLGGDDDVVPATAVVLAHTRVSDPGPADVARSSGLPVFVIGDALAPRRLTHAVLEGSRFGMSL